MDSIGDKSRRFLVKKVGIHEEEIQALLDAADEQGWDLVSITPKGSGFSAFIVVFQRKESHV